MPPFCAGSFQLYPIWLTQDTKEPTMPHVPRQNTQALTSSYTISTHSSPFFPPKLLLLLLLVSTAREKCPFLTVCDAYIHMQTHPSFPPSFSPLPSHILSYFTAKLL